MRFKVNTTQIKFVTKAQIMQYGFALSVLVVHFLAFRPGVGRDNVSAWGCHCSIVPVITIDRRIAGNEDGA